jgi:hypothetical protein
MPRPIDYVLPAPSCLEHQNEGGFPGGGTKDEYLPGRAPSVSSFRCYTENPEPLPMYCAPIPEDDAARVATLRAYSILDSPPEQGYDDVTALAVHICQTPFSTVTFVDQNRQWFKSEAGFGTNETGRAEGFCACAVLSPEMMVIEDASLDPRFRENPFVLGGPRIRFYAGAPPGRAEPTHPWHSLRI